MSLTRYVRLVTAGVSAIAMMSTGAFASQLDIEPRTRAAPATTVSELAAVERTVTNAEARVGDSTGLLHGEGARIVVTDAAGSSVRVEFGSGRALQVGLPDTGAVRQEWLSPAGRRIVTGQGAVDLVTQVDDTGAPQFLAVLRSKNAPREYSFRPAFGENTSVKLRSNGGAEVISADKKDTVEVAPPWAVDANGRSVPTHFEVRGAALVQVVDHHTGDFAYPIVADPKYKKRFGNLGGELVFNIKETRKIADGVGAIAGILAGCSVIPAAQPVCGPLAGALSAFAGYFMLMDAMDRCGKFYHLGPISRLKITSAPGGQRRGDFGCK